MKTKEEKILLSILDNLHVRHDSVLLDHAADYTPILEAVIEGIINGMSEGKEEDIKRRRQKMYAYAREFLLELCLGHREYEEDLDQFIEAGTVWIDPTAIS